VQAQGEVLAGLVACGVLMGAADGQATDEEMAVIAGMINGFVQGQATEAQIMGLIRDIANGIRRQGAPSVLQQLPNLLPSAQLRWTGLVAGAAVMISDGDFDEANEGPVFVALAQSLGFSRQEAQRAIQEAAELFQN